MRRALAIVLVSACFRPGDRLATDASGGDEPWAGDAATAPPFQAYLKGSTTAPTDELGKHVALSADGTTLAVAAPLKSGGRGAVYVFAREGTVWTQQGELTPDSLQNGNLGMGLAISADGSTIVAGQPWGPTEGLAKVYRRTTIEAIPGWEQEKTLWASNAHPNAFFGAAVAIAGNGTVIAVGAYDENSIGAPENVQTFAGAVHVFERTTSDWMHTANFKGSDTREGDYFGMTVALSNDGTTLAVGALSLDRAAVYMFHKHAGTWEQTAKLTPAHQAYGSYFGFSIALSADGSLLAVGAPRDDSGGHLSGATYLFRQTMNTWSELAYLKASNPGGGTVENGDWGDGFGTSVALDPTGSLLLVGAPYEASSAVGFAGDQLDNSMLRAGAVYAFDRVSQWSQRTYIKASNTEAGDEFGSSVAISASGVAAVGAWCEASAATGINGDQSNNAAPLAGAVYAFTVP